MLNISSPLITHIFLEMLWMRGKVRFFNVKGVPKKDARLVETKKILSRMGVFWENPVLYEREQ